MRYSLVALMFALSSMAFADSNEEHCLSELKSSDVIAEDFDENGNRIEYLRTDEDIEKLVARLEIKIKYDPVIKQLRDWDEGMLTTKYWKSSKICGGTKNCSTKSCSSGKSCKYVGGGMSGCRCVKY